MKKILFINNHYYPSVGGTEKVAQKVLEHFAVKKNYQCFVISLLPEKRRINEKNGVKIIQQGGFADLIKAIQAIKPDFIHLNTIYNKRNLKLLLYLKRKLRGVKFILNPIKLFTFTECIKVKSLARLADKLSLLPRVLLGLLANLADNIIYVDKKNKDYRFDKHFIFDKSKIKIISQGIEINEFKSKKQSEVRQRYKLPKHYDVSIANLVKTKNHKELLSFYQSTDRNLVLAFTKYPQDQDIKKQLAEIKRPNLICLEEIPREDLITILNGADLHITFSYTEGAQSNVMLECLQLGLPYIHSDNGQNYSYFPHCYFFKNTPHLKSLLQSTNWRDERLKILNDCKDYIKTHKMSWPEVFIEYEKLFR